MSGTVLTALLMSIKDNNKDVIKEHVLPSAVKIINYMFL